MTKKLFYSLLAIFCICLSGSMHGMKRNNTTLTVRNPKYQKASWLPNDLITKIAGYCWPKEKNKLMRLNKQYRECLKDRTAILRENPSTVSWLDKHEAMIQYAGLGDMGMMQLLLANGVKAMCKNEIGISPFHVANENSQVKAMQLLIDNGVDVNDPKPKMYPLHQAVYQGDIKAVQILLASSKINLELALDDGVTALMFASKKGYTDIVKLLLDKGANVNRATNKYRVTPLMFASENGHTEIVRLLLDKGANVNEVVNDGVAALMFASQNGHTEIAKLLLDAKADVNQIANDGTTVLMIASQNGHRDIVKLLLDYGANVRHEDKSGITALRIAVECKMPDIVELLFNYATEYDKKYAFFDAVDFHDRDMVALLLKKGVDIHCRDNDGMSALAHASYDGDIEAVKLLLDYGVDVNRVTKSAEETSALLLAVEYCHTEIVELLVEKGADVNHVDSNGCNALSIAAYYDHSNVVSLLLDKGVNIHQQITAAFEMEVAEGDTPLQIAQKMERTEIVELIEEYLQREKTKKTAIESQKDAF